MALYTLFLWSVNRIRCSGAGKTLDFIRSTYYSAYLVKDEFVNLK